MSSDIRKEWSLFYEKQVLLRRRYGSVWGVPLKRRHTDVVLEWLEPGLSVLEVGAGDRNIFHKVDLESYGLDYRSLDPDDSLPHDYRSVATVERTFQRIWMFEVIEHLGLEDGFELLGSLLEILEPGGVLILTTPNGHHPHRFREPHHLTPFKYDNLGALLLLAGFEVEGIYRLHNDSILMKIAHRYLLQWLHRFLDIDFAPSLLAVARRPAGKMKEKALDPSGEPFYIHPP